jgi:hypothetical protein
MEHPNRSVAESEGDDNAIRVIAIWMQEIFARSEHAFNLSANPSQKVKFVDVDFHEHPTTQRFALPPLFRPNAREATAEPMNGQTQQSPQLTAVHQLLHFRVDGEIAENLSNHQVDAIFAASLNHSVALF